MLSRLTKKGPATAGRLTYSNVVSTICLFAVVGGGTAIAATVAKDSVTSKSIKNKTIKGKDVKPDGLTGAQVKESSLDLSGLGGATGPKGDTGPAGADGAPGPKGDTGPAGPAGPAGSSTGAAGGQLSGNYPNPSIALGVRQRLSTSMDGNIDNDPVNITDTAAPGNTATFAQTSIPAGGGEAAVSSSIRIENTAATNPVSVTCWVEGSGLADEAGKQSTDAVEQSIPGGGQRQLAVTGFLNAPAASAAGVMTALIKCIKGGTGTPVFVSGTTTIVAQPNLP